MVVLFAVLPFFSTLLGGIAVLRLRQRLQPIMAFAAGAVLATAASELLPESAEMLGPEMRIPHATAVLVGYILFAALDALLHSQSWGHQHDLEGKLPSPNPLGFVPSLGLVVHSSLDGIAIGLGFSRSPELGFLVGMAVVTHDFADGMNVVTLALDSLHRLRPAAWLLFLDAVAPPLGVLASHVVPLSNEQLGFLLAGFSGVFIAIGASHLLPEAQHQRPGLEPRMVLWTAIGAVVVLATHRVLG